MYFDRRDLARTDGRRADLLRSAASFMSKTLLNINQSIFITRQGEVFVLLYVRLFVCFLFVLLSTISRQPVGRFTPNFACGRTLGPDVSSPLLGVTGPRPREVEKGEMKFSLL